MSSSVPATGRTTCISPLNHDEERELAVAHFHEKFTLATARPTPLRRTSVICAGFVRVGET
jgi:hypothetical protein